MGGIGLFKVNNGLQSAPVMIFLLAPEQPPLTLKHLQPTHHSRLRNCEGKKEMRGRKKILVDI